FVFYQFAPHPVFFNQAEWRRHAQDGRFRDIEAEHAGAVAQSQSAIRAWLQARASDVTARQASARALMVAASDRTHAIRAEAKAALVAADPRANAQDSDYVFITFILTQLPHGAVGLLVAVMFAAVIAQALVIVKYFSLNIGYLWYNLIGCAVCIA